MQVHLPVKCQGQWVKVKVMSVTNYLHFVGSLPSIERQSCYCYYWLLAITKVVPL